MKSHVLALFQSRPSRKIGQDQPKVIISTLLVLLKYPMLHAKFQGNWSIGSGVEDFKKAFTTYGHGGLIGHVT